MVKFLYGRPRFTPQEFFNYEELLAISDYIKDRGQPYMIVGPRRTGKTSLLHVVGHLLRKQGLLTTFIDLEAGRAEGSLSPISFNRMYSFTLIEDYLDQVGLREKVRFSVKKIIKETGSRVISGLSRFLERIEELGGKVGDELSAYVKLHVDVESRALERRPYADLAEQALTEALELPERLAKVAERKLVVMIDEFQFLRDLKQALPGVLHLFRNKYQSHRNARYLVSGSAIGLVTDIVSSRDQPFYGFFLVQSMPPFDNRTSIRFLEEGYKSEGLKASAKTLHYISERADGLPAWLNYVGLDSSRATHAKGKRVVSLKMVKRTFHKMMSDPGVVGAMERDLRMLEREVRSPRIVETLQIVARADEPIGASEVWAALREKERRPLPQPKTYEYLNRLIDFGFLEKTDQGRFRYLDPILREFLRASYRHR